jgi:hypothetical protein
MNNIFKNWSRNCKNWGQMLLLVIIMSLVLPVSPSRAQESNQGNTTIFGGAELTIFGNQDCIAPEGGSQPGVILTERTTATISYLNFFGDGLINTGASNSRYVDGYVRKYGAGQFIFPVGDNGHLGQFAASADGTNGAYFYANPNTSITSNVFSGSNYPALPAGAPFATSSKDATIRSVSNIEYWDINGEAETPLTLTWSHESNITTLTSSTLSALAIVGWDGTKWVKIPASVDVTSVLGGASTLNAGSITTRSSIVPNAYIAYTLAEISPDLTPNITLPNSNFARIGASKNFTAGLFEVLGAVAGEGIQFSITVPTGYTIAFNSSQTTITPSGVAIPTTINNNDWTVVSTTLGGRRLTLQAKPGIKIQAFGNSILGFAMQRSFAQTGGSSITVNIINDISKSIYDSVDENNIYARGINTF